MKSKFLLSMYILVISIDFVPLRVFSQQTFAIDANLIPNSLTANNMCSTHLPIEGERDIFVSKSYNNSHQFRTNIRYNAYRGNNILLSISNKTTYNYNHVDFIPKPEIANLYLPSLREVKRFKPRAYILGAIIGGAVGGILTATNYMLPEYYPIMILMGAGTGMGCVAVVDFSRR